MEIEGGEKDLYIPNQLGKGAHEARAQHAEFLRQIQEQEVKSAEAKRHFENEIEPKLRPASKGDYEDWLWSYMKKEGQPTNYYDYPFERVAKTMFKAKDDFKMTPLYGAQAIHVIVPEGVKFLGGELGHSTLYFADGHVEGRWVPVYEDMVP